MAAQQEVTAWDENGKPITTPDAGEAAAWDENGKPIPVSLEAPNSAQRVSQVTTGFQHPIDELVREGKDIVHHPLEFGKDLAQTAGIPREFWSHPIEQFKNIGGSGIPGMVFGEHGLIRDPIGFGEGITGANELSEDVRSGNLKGIPGDVAGGVINLAALKGPARQLGEQAAGARAALTPMRTRRAPMGAYDENAQAWVPREPPTQIPAAAADRSAVPITESPRFDPEAYKAGRLQAVGKPSEPASRVTLEPDKPEGGRLTPIGKARSPRGYFNPGRSEPVKLDDVVNQATGVKPLKADVPLNEQLTKTTANEPAEIDPVKEKYPDPKIRQMVRANGEEIYEAAKGNPATVQGIHDLTRVDLRQALINAGEDMGQQTISNSKFAGEGSISRESAFKRLLEKGHSADDIVRLAKMRTAPPAEAGNLVGKQTTEDRYFDAKKGEWAPERRAIHDKVINDAIAGKTPPRGRAPEATITIGGTGAGKTTLTRRELGDNPNMVNVDADVNKLHIPEFEGLKKSDPQNAAFRVHEESSHIAKRTVGAAVQKGLDFVFDTSTGGGGPALFAKLKQAGYKVRVLFADVPTDTAIERAATRAQSSTDPANRGRYVPESVIREKHLRAAKAFDVLRSSPHVDELHGFDTTSRTPEKFYERVGSRETIHDQGRLDAVQRKAAGQESGPARAHAKEEPALVH